MKGQVLKYGFSELGITAEQVEQFMGYGFGEDSSLVRELVLEIMAEAEEVADIRAHYAIFETVRIDQAEKKIVIAGKEFDVHRIVFAQLKKSEAFAVFACTAGPELGNRSKRAMAERDLLRGYVYDVIGSEIAESATDMMQEDLKNLVEASGMKITNRYSPGYCGWSVSEQHKLFSLMPYNYCGIRLTESALMDPVKSVSGIIGLGRDVRLNPYTCGMCDMKDCIYRRKEEVRVR